MEVIKHNNGVRSFLDVFSLEDVFEQAMIRDSPMFIPLPDTGPSLDLGGGNKVMVGWHRLDYPEWDAEALLPLPFSVNSVNAVYCAHALDHLSAEAVVFLLGDVQRILKPGCAFTIVVPHFMSTLAHECIEHKTQFGIKTWRNILDNPAYAPLLNGSTEWQMRVGFNRIMGVEERNLVLVTQLIKEP